MMRSTIPITAALTLWWAGCAKMGSPSGGGVDRVAPTVIAHSPSADATDVALGSSVVIEFSESMNRRRTKEAIFVAPRTELRYSWSGRKLELDFEAGLQTNQTYIITIGTDARDLRNNSLEQSFTLAFATGSALNQGRIAGRVFKDRKPAASAFVWAYAADRFQGNLADESPAYETQSGRDGAYAFERLSAGRYCILAFVDGNRNKRHDEGELLALPSGDVEVGEEDSEEGVRAGDLSLRVAATTLPVLERVRALDSRRILLLFDSDIDVSHLSLSLDGLAVKTKYAAPNDASRVYVLTAPQKGGKAYRVELHMGDQPIVWDEPLRGSSRDDAKAPSVEHQEPRQGKLAKGDSLRVIFSEAMDTTATPDAWVRTDSTEAPQGVWRWRDLLTLAFRPTQPFEPGPHDLRARTVGLTDRAGNAVADSVVAFTFEVPTQEELAAVAGVVKGARDAPAIWVVAQDSDGTNVYPNQTGFGRRLHAVGHDTRELYDVRL